MSDISEVDLQSENDALPSKPKRGLGSRGRHAELEVALGARIRAARVVAHMSQRALGEKVGVTFQQFQKYESGTDRVSASTLQGIAVALGVHPGSFFDGEMTMPTGSIPDVKAAMRIAERVQRIRNPDVLKRLMALVDVLAQGNEGGVGKLDVGASETAT